MISQLVLIALVIMFLSFFSLIHCQISTVSPFTIFFYSYFFSFFCVRFKDEFSINVVFVSPKLCSERDYVITKEFKRGNRIPF